MKLKVGHKMVQRRRIKIKTKVVDTLNISPEENNKPVNINHGEKWFSFKRLKNKLKEKFFESSIVIINMELINGMHKSFYVKGKHEGFSFMKGRYVFDEDLKYYNIDMRSYCYDYHQGLAIPIKRKIPLKDIRDVIMNANITEIEYATNPSSLENFMVAKVAEGIMRGQQIDEFLKQNRLIWIITMVASVIMLILFVWKTGMMANVHIPGIN